MAPASSNHPDSEEKAGRHPAGPRPSSEDRLAGLTQQLQALLENAISTPGRWHMLLDTSATLWRYSGGNVALLMAQMEERGQQQPLLVAGFREWERHGRNVLKGEHALWVLAPRTAAKNTETNPDTDAKPTPVASDQDSGSGKDADHRRIVGWRAQAVFDVSQTEGQPLYIPRPMVEVGSSPMGLWPSLVNFARNQGFTVEQSMSQYGLTSGYTDFAGHKIQVGAWLGQEERVAVLAHELGHVCLHGPDDKLGKLYGSGLDHRGLAEVEAESVAYTVLRAHGIDRSAQSGSYLAGWADQVIAVEQTSQLEASAGKEPASRLEIARSTLARVTSACRSILDVTQPHNLGGKPATTGVAVDYDRGDLTGPVTGHQTIGYHSEARRVINQASHPVGHAGGDHERQEKKMGTRIPVSINGNLVADPELSFGESGIAHAKLRVAVNQRFQAADGTWRDGIPVFHNVSAFRGLAENVAASLKKGDPVMVTGELEFRSYEKDGAQHEARRIVAEVVGPDLRFGTSSYERTPKAAPTVTVGSPEQVRNEPRVTNRSGWEPAMPTGVPSVGRTGATGLQM